MPIDPIVINGHRNWPWSVTRHGCCPVPVRRFGAVAIEFEAAVCEWLDSPFLSRWKPYPLFETSAIPQSTSGNFPARASLSEDPQPVVPRRILRVN
jgi:hypothetical protein